MHRFIKNKMWIPMPAIEEVELKTSNCFKDKLYNRVFVCLMIATLFIVNIWHYNRDKAAESKMLRNIITPYQEIITAGLVNNLQRILAGYPISSFDTNLIFNIKPLDSQRFYKEELRIKPYSIEIANANSLITIDMVSLKEYFSNVLPPYIHSKINLGNVQLLNSDIVDNTYANHIKHKLGKDLELGVILSIDTKSSFYLEINRKTARSIQNIMIISTIIWGLIMLTYYLSYKNVLNKISYLTRSFHNAETKITYYAQRLAIAEDLNRSFIRKATEIYEKQSGTENNTHLFPLILIDPTKSAFNLKDLQNDLEQYFSVVSSNVLLNINLEQELVHYPFSKEILYQLLFSIIRDIILISRDQSEKQQIITVDFNKTGINFEFQAFPLNVQKLGKLSRILNENQPEMFLLDFDRILLSLEKHNMEYKLSNEGNKNIFQIILASNTQKLNVIKFNKKLI